MRLVKFTLFLTVVTILVCLSMLIGIALTYTGDTNLPDDQIGGAGEEITPPAIDIELSMAVIPDADGKVPEGGVSASDDKATVEIPAGVQLEEGAESLTFTATSMEETQSTVAATHRSEVVHSMDVHVNGVSKANTVPMTIKLNGILPTGLNSNNVKLFHVENGETVEMTLTTTPVNHNEFSYNPLTGDAVITIASFSEIVAYGDTNNPWDGKTFDYDWYDANATELTIANAEQFAAFRNIVDGGYYEDGEGEGAKKTWKSAPYQDSFEGKTVTLSNNIDLGDHLFDPIGFGYDYDGFMADGKTFNGTFDGNGKTIFNLYQNGWDLDPNPGVYDTYTYSMAGGGLFASVVDATIKNLTMSGADIVFECVDMGVVCGYAQGNCTFDNISIINCTIQNYNRYTGGVVGEVSPKYNADGTPVEYTLEDGTVVKGGYHVFNNINVDSSTTVSSLWGSFDTSLGGILGGKWDKNGAETKVTMTDCHVACTIDAFNDVTSAYQWYAYRRAGMLVGNTEQSADHKALANFLTCEDVYVYYGEWNNYHYCEFTNQSGSENASWQNNYPWVRNEAGLSCSAYSNPRYGHPIVNGEYVQSEAHDHLHDKENNQCTISLPFAQLYGGGQGVYGATEHDGVISSEAYTVTYKDGDKTIKVDFVEDNKVAYTVDDGNYKVGNLAPDYWIDANGNRISSIAAGNKQNYVLTPVWPDHLVINFVDHDNTVLYSENFKKNESHELDAEAINNVLAEVQNRVDATEKIITADWDTDFDTIKFEDADDNIVVKITYSLANLNVKLVPVHSEDDNTKIIAYEIAKTGASNAEDVIVPEVIGNVPVVKITAGTFEEYSKLESIMIPGTLTEIGSNAFENGPTAILGFETGGRNDVTIYYSGKPEDWRRYMDLRYEEDNKTKDNRYDDYNGDFGSHDDKTTILVNSWDNGLKEGSRIFFVDKNGKVIEDAGYWELFREGNDRKPTFTWVYHNHRYGEAHDSNEGHNNCGNHVSADHTNYNDPNRGDHTYWTSDEQ